MPPFVLSGLTRHCQFTVIMDTFFGSFQRDNPYLQLAGAWGYKVYQKRELIWMYIHLIFAALLPIYTGAHASLRRPPSAAPSPKATGNADPHPLRHFHSSKSCHWPETPDYCRSVLTACLQ